MRYKASSRPLPEIARELNVDALVSGAVIRAGDRILVSAELIDPQTESQIWSRRYERDLRDVFALQNEIARAIAEEIRLTLSPRDQVRLQASRAINPMAHDAYLKGLFHWYRLSPQALETAQKYFEFALQHDATHSLSWLALPMCGVVVWHSTSFAFQRRPHRCDKPRSEQWS